MLKASSTRRARMSEADSAAGSPFWRFSLGFYRRAGVADALRLGGLLATVGTHHIAGGTWTEEFFVEIQECYERFDPATPPGLRLEAARDIPEDDRELTRGVLIAASCRTRPGRGLRSAVRCDCKVFPAWFHATTTERQPRPA